MIHGMMNIISSIRQTPGEKALPSFSKTITPDMSSLAFMIYVFHVWSWKYVRNLSIFFVFATCHKSDLQCLQIRASSRISSLQFGHFIYFRISIDIYYTFLHIVNLLIPKMHRHDAWLISFLVIISEKYHRPIESHLAQVTYCGIS